MYVKIENSGCCERKGMMQVRFDFCLEEGDPRHEEFRPSDKNGDPIGEESCFHTHFVYVDPEITDEELLAMGEKILQDASSRFKNEQSMNIQNKPVAFNLAASESRKKVIVDRVNQIKGKALIRGKIG